MSSRIKHVVGASRYRTCASAKYSYLPTNVKRSDRLSHFYNNNNNYGVEDDIFAAPVRRVT